MTSAVSMMLDVENSLLVVIDVQQRLLSAMPDGVATDLVHQTGVLMQAANGLSVPIIVTEQYPKGLGSTVEPLQAYLLKVEPIEKTCFACTGADDFMSGLRNSHRRQIVLVGMEAHICVLQTALALLAQGYQVFVVEDAISSRTQQNQTNALQRLYQAGIIMTNTESVLFEWLGDAKHPEFRTLSKLIV